MTRRGELPSLFRYASYRNTGQRGGEVQLFKLILALIAVSLYSAEALAQASGKCKIDGDRPEVIKACSDLLRRNPKDVLALEARAVAYIGENNNLAMADLSNAIKLKPTAVLYFRRAAVFGLKDDYAQAIKDLIQAITLNPGFAEAYKMRGHVQFVQRDYDKAVSDLTQAIALDPNLLSAYQLRVQVYVRQDRPALAIADYDALIQRDPKDASSRTSRGEIYQRMGEVDKAIADHSKAIETRPKFLLPYDNLARAYLQKGEPDQALVTYRRAMEANPKVASIDYEGRAYAYFQKADYGAAANDFKVVVNPKNKDSFAFLFLFLARTFAGEDSAAELAANAANADAASWPHQIAELLLGKLAPPAVLAAAKGDDQQCEANFFIGEYQRLQKNTEAAKAALETAAKNCPHISVERRLAVTELKRLKP